MDKWIRMDGWTNRQIDKVLDGQRTGNMGNIKKNTTQIDL